MSNSISVSVQEQVKTIIQLKNFDAYETLPSAQAVLASKSLLFDHCFIHIVKFHLSPECLSQPLNRITNSKQRVFHIARPLGPPCLGRSTCCIGATRPELFLCASVETFALKRTRWNFPSATSVGSLSISFSVIKLLVPSNLATLAAKTPVVGRLSLTIALSCRNRPNITYAQSKGDNHVAPV